jgi:hypothetical protein
MTQEYANKVLYTDVEPFEVVETRTERKKMIRPMKATLKPDWKPDMIPGGFAAHTVNNYSQEYDYESLPNEETFAIRQRKNGKWFDKYGNRYNISDKPRRFYDYNF